MDALDGWEWNLIEADFQRGVASFKQFVEREGHGRVRYVHKEEDGFALGKWAANRRSDYTEGILSQDRIDQLDALDGWKWDLIEADFQRGVASFKQFVEQEGHGRVHFWHKEEDGFTLGLWVSRRRADYTKGTLSQDRIDQLDALDGWKWNPIEADFQRGVASFKQFVEQEGNGKSPSKA